MGFEKSGENKCVCPAGKVPVDCATCPERYRKECVACPEKQVKNEKTQTCECHTGLVKNPEVEWLCICSDASKFPTPDGTKCVDCPVNQWNNQTQQCEDGPGESENEIKTTLSTGVLVAIIVSGVLLILLMIAVLWCFCCRKKTVNGSVTDGGSLENPVEKKSPRRSPSQKKKKKNLELASRPRSIATQRQPIGSEDIVVGRPILNETSEKHRIATRGKKSGKVPASRE